MPILDPRVDAYIWTAPAFARPVLPRLRSQALGRIDVEKSRNWKYERT